MPVAPQLAAANEAAEAAQAGEVDVQKELLEQQELQL